MELLKFQTFAIDTTNFFDKLVKSGSIKERFFVKPMSRVFYNIGLWKGGAIRVLKIYMMWKDAETG
jgi:hypothetical protein